MVFIIVIIIPISSFEVVLDTWAGNVPINGLGEIPLDVSALFLHTKLRYKMVKDSSDSVQSWILIKDFKI